MRQKIDNKVLITGIIVVGIILAIFIGGKYFGGYNPQNTITANGISSIKVTPDLVTIYLGIESKAGTSSEANDKATEIYSKLKTSLMDLGFAEEEIQTQSFNIYPNYDYSSGNPRITSYTASHSLKVEITTEETEKIAEIVDSSLTAGASIGSVNFELSMAKQNEAKAEAIKLAAEDAKLKAEALADGVGKKLGSLVSVSSSDFYYSPWNVYTSDSYGSTAVKEAVTSIIPSEQEITASVNAVFKIR